VSAVQARNINTAAEGIYKMKNQKLARTSNFIQRTEGAYCEAVKEVVKSYAPARRRA